MCPGCIATVALIAAGVTSTGGLTALVITKLRSKKAKNKGDNDGSFKSRVAG